VEPAESKRYRGLVRIERWLFGLGIAFLCIYAGAFAYSRFSQAYYDWAFERVLRDEPAPLLEFVRDRISGPLRRMPEPSVPVPASRKAPTGASVPVYTPGSPIGRLEIPAIDLSVMVLEGTGRLTLTSGVGHIEGTALPGRPGNFGIAGHRDSFFRALKDIGPDDIIKVTTLSGTYEYQVEKTRIVQPSNVSVLQNRERPTLTLVTCYPFYYVGSAPKRFIVQATLIDRTVRESFHQ
jgi:LPXTG-site transpeptidase (sortase) family protein